MKIIAILLSALALTACSGDVTTDNRNGLGVAQSVYGVALTGALAYKRLPPCPAPLAWLAGWQPCVRWPSALPFGLGSPVWPQALWPGPRSAARPATFWARRSRSLKWSC